MLVEYRKHSDYRELHVSKEKKLYCIEKMQWSGRSNKTVLFHLSHSGLIVLE